MKHQFKPLLYLPIVLGGVAFTAILAFLFGLFVMLLWNWLMPAIFGLRTITYWQSWGLVLLAHLLFKTGYVNSHERKHNETWKDSLRNRFSKGFKERTQNESHNNGITDSNENGKIKS